MGQVLLLSRRLIESGVLFVTADAVSNLESTFRLRTLSSPLFGCLTDLSCRNLIKGCPWISDLEQRGLLQEIRIIVMGEMSRRPTIYNTEEDGSGHWNRTYSVLFVRADIRLRQVVGATDRHMGEVKESPTRSDALDT